jgi:hypothetical protein
LLIKFQTSKIFIFSSSFTPSISKITFVYKIWFFLIRQKKMKRYQKLWHKCLGNTFLLSVWLWSIIVKCYTAVRHIESTGHRVRSTQVISPDVLHSSTRMFKRFSILHQKIVWQVLKHQNNLNIAWQIDHLVLKICCRLPK